MDEDRDGPAEETRTLATLDLMAGHVLAVHALLPTLPPRIREELCARLEPLLLAIGRRMAAELPFDASGPDARAPDPAGSPRDGPS